MAVVQFVNGLEEDLLAFQAFEPLSVDAERYALPLVCLGKVDFHQISRVELDNGIVTHPPRFI